MCINNANVPKRHRSLNSLYGLEKGKIEQFIFKIDDKVRVR